ncbi:MAG: hypothetical protein K2Z81_06420, partial [Cyanobacteria bacterium]|nr:hypothetical protein [Cyanobacteriota bacterium]
MERIAGQTDSGQSKKKFRLRKAVLAGQCPSVEKGSFVRASGKWVETPRHGLQLRASSICHVAPSSQEACKRYLKTFRGLGPKRAKEIVEAFPQESVLDVLSSNPRRLLEVKGIGESALRNIVAQWDVRRAQYEAASFLHGVGIGPAIAERLASFLGGTAEACAKEVRSDPYGVVEKSRGLLSFPHADGIATGHLGVSLTDVRRVREAVVYMTARLAWSGGHTCISSEAVAQATTRLLKVRDVALVRSAMNDERFLRLPSVDEGITVSPLKLFQAEIA